ncbi:hypothetical protein MVEN_00133300 [Mycena venus]|uniref:Uncharacterized protein n=1 Tax=Mycena venus TaxID=2733690 RepID=A0A8H7DEP8_9AGAR|nr:hypothetical protein MVEN_00133300 [Mycena venus]
MLTSLFQTLDAKILVLPALVSFLDANILSPNPTPTSLVFNANFLSFSFPRHHHAEIVDETDNVTKQPEKTAAVKRGDLNTLRFAGPRWPGSSNASAAFPAPANTRPSSRAPRISGPTASTCRSHQVRARCGMSV